MPAMSVYFPICLNIQKMNCVVVGGGEVAERKTAALLEHGAAVTVITAHVTKGLGQLADSGSIVLLRRGYQRGDLAQASIAIAATDDPSVNRQVAEDAKQLRILTNVVDDPEHSDFILPSVLRRGNVTIAVSTDGKSPALSRKIRTDMERTVGPEYATLVLLISDVRDQLKRDGARVAAETWQRSLELDDLLDMLRRGQVQEAKQRLLSALLPR